MKIGAIKQSYINFKGVENIKKKNVKQKVSNANYYPEENIFKRCLAGLGFLGFIFLFFATKRQRLLLESGIVKKKLNNMQNSAQKLLHDFQIKADDISGFINQGAKNSFQDVYENSILVRRFIVKDGCHLPSVMEEYTSNGKLARKIKFLDCKNFDVKEYKGKLGGFNVIKVKDGLVNAAATGIRKLPFNFLFINNGIADSDNTFMVFKNIFLNVEKNKIKIFINKAADFKGVKSSFLKYIKTNGKTTNIAKGFYFLNNGLASIGLNYNPVQTKNGSKLVAEEFYKVDKNGTLKAIRENMPDMEFLHDAFMDFLF